ncbi:MAG: hypothetical protein WDZ51_07665 [Pirellulaceae bacterium]
MKRHSQNHLARPSRLARPSHLAGRNRRGALLLVVLSMLVLFSMIGLTFVVTAGHFRRAADASLRAEPEEQDPAREMDAILGQLIRGPQVGSRSGMLGHDLLRDIWGNVTIEFPAVSGVDFTRPQMTRIRVLIGSLPEFPAGNPSPDNGYRVSKIEDYYSGTVLTFTTGAAAGQSHRILRYIPTFEMDGETFQYVDFFIDPEPETNRGRIVNNAGNQLARPAVGDAFIVNGHPFSGTGVGYFWEVGQTIKPGLTLRDGNGHPVALIPNIAHAYPGGVVPNGPHQGLPIEAGGANESYTAPDYQNMYLAYLPLDEGLTPDQISQRTLPSFHRPDLIDYWARQLAEDDPMGFGTTYPDQPARRSAFRNPAGITDDAVRDRVIGLLRKISLRPLQVDNPNFTGSNLTYDPFGRNNSRYDIDNDLDGIPESIWIDPGLPIKTDKQGRRYRPLVAILVRDLDALLNVNAHGFYSHLAGFNNTDPITADEANVAHNMPSHSPSRDAGNNPTPMPLPLGSGYGPADVNLASLFRPDSTLSLLRSRYGFRIFPPDPDVPPFGTPEGANPRPGYNEFDDQLSRLTTLGVPNLSATNSLLAAQFGTPPDRLGHGYTYLDYDGKPRWMQLQPSSGFAQTGDDPYESNLYRRENADHHFTYQDLERVLRYEEYDSSQLQVDGDRLLTAGYNTLVRDPGPPVDIIGPARKRRLITTGSWQVPTPARVPVPRDGHTEERLNASIETPAISTLLHARIEAANAGWSEAEVNHAMLALLPSEMLKGEKLDLNRLLEAPPGPAHGNLEDVFTLATKQLEEFQSSFAASGAYDVQSDFINGAVSGAFNLPRPPGWNTPNIEDPTVHAGLPTAYSASRQLMARHLYVLMLLITDPKYVHPTVDDSLDELERRELTLRRIAQWAINVVDYRDKDGVMTPFEYDLNPFTDSDGSRVTTWNVDGDIRSTSPDTALAHRRVVWGAEAPDLIITETLAFHDRRTRDTEWDDGPGSRRNSPASMNHDPTLDQYRIPQGSLFMEFYNPRNTIGNFGALNSVPSTQPKDLYGPNGELHLNRVTPGGFPVWRVVISSTELDTTSSGTRENLINEMATRPDTINFQPRNRGALDDPSNFKMLGNAGTNSLENYETERIVYFANVEVTRPALVEPHVFFYRDPANADLGIFPGEYFVVGPRQKTVIGSAPDPDNPTAPQFSIDGAQQITLSAPYSGIFNFAGMPYAAAAAIKPFRGIAVTADYPDVWGAVDAAEDPDGEPVGIGLSISEPIPNDDYYPKPTVLNEEITPQLMDLYTDGATGAVTCPDVPFDTDPNNDYPLSLNRDLARSSTFPDKEDVTEPEFVQGYKTAILQRLANPLSDHNAELNPYITVDAMPIDLTTYNGEDSLDNPERDTMVPANQWDPDEEDEEGDNQDARSTFIAFASRERGRRNLEFDVALTPELLEIGASTGNLMGMLRGQSMDLATFSRRVNQTPAHFDTPRTLENTAMESEHFGRVLRHTLGYGNHTFGAPITPAPPINAAYAGSPMPTETRPENPYADPPVPRQVENNPFGWLQWSNRPYVSAYELMQVPSSSPQRLLYGYTYRRQQAGGGLDLDPYAFTTDGDNTGSQKAPYGHLLNFFHTSDSLASDDGSTVPNTSQGSHYARIFDFVHVPTRFNDAYKWFSPVDPSVPNNFNPDYTGLAVDDPRIGYQFPFNKRSRFREPGKINLNTMPARDVYHAIFDPRLWSEYPGMSFPTWEQFQQSRRGREAVEDPNFPSRFSNPFRAASGAEMMSEVGASGDAANVRNRLRKRPTEATILRSRRGTDMATPDPDRTPLFDYRLDGSQPASMHRHHNPHANPMFRYQAYQRLGNIAGTQSNVFAVWMTVGYFELEPTDVDAANPDGWALGEELGTDTGDIRRHRGFYIIDRSIPVGYQPGRDHNVENVIQLKRFIE